MSSSTHNFDSEWHICEFWFNRSRKVASILNPGTGSRMELPRQDRLVDGFCLHEYCDFSLGLSSYLRYLKTHHILLFSEVPEIVHVANGENSEASDYVWGDEGTFSYHTLMFRVPAAETKTLPYLGFSFINDQLYSSVYMKIVETN